MKFYLSSWLIAATSLTSFHPTSVDAVGGGLRSSPDRRLQNGNAYGKWKKCVTLLKEIQMEDKTDLSEVDCYDPETKEYHRLEASLEAKVKKDMKEGKAKSGSTIMNADGTYSTNGDGHRVLRVSDVDSITYEDYVPDHGRRLAVTTGTKNMLAIRVVAADTSTTASEDEISDSWFGTYDDPVNLKSQYSACSYGALTCNAASKTTSTGVAVSNGVYEVTIGNTVSGEADGVIRDAVVAAGNSALGNMQNQFDHVMLCLPPGTSGGWIGYAYINWYLSVFNDDWCTYLSIQMHEIGHNLDLAHSGEGTNQYGDQTAMMGYSYSQDDGPKMCFNAPKNWQLGWYPNGEHEVVNNFFEGKILGLSDYENLNSANNEIIMAKINDSVSDWYVSYNRATGINSGTREGQNQVLVHKRQQGTGYATSELMAKLNAGGVYNGIVVDGSAVPVSVISINTSGVGGYAQVKIGNAPPVTSSPTKSPTTAAPTAPPTPEPTESPTTAAPTALPTPGPTVSPTTAAPTAPPTPEPTALPTSPPTSGPTASPTTAAPTPLPTPEPTSLPTNQPTSAPTVPIDCTEHTNERVCPAGTCRWIGKNWKSGECVDADGNGPTPIPTKPPTSAPSPTPPPNPPTGCDDCYGEPCCGTCKNWGKPSTRGCLV
jgi:hypothetical protein